MHEPTKQQSARDTARETWRRGGGLVRPRINKAGVWGDLFRGINVAILQYISPNTKDTLRFTDRESLLTSTTPCNLSSFVSSHTAERRAEMAMATTGMPSVPSVGTRSGIAILHSAARRCGSCEKREPFLSGRSRVPFLPLPLRQYFLHSHTDLGTYANAPFPQPISSLAKGTFVSMDP